MEIPYDDGVRDALLRKGYANCTNCEKPLDRMDVSWNNASTEAGTPCCWIDVICSECGSSASHFSSWWPGIDGDDDLIHVIDSDMSKR